MPFIASLDAVNRTTATVGNGHCVKLVQALLPAIGTTPMWRPGAAVASGLAAGTAIATFVKGKYENDAIHHRSHAAIYLRHVGTNIEVFDQYIGKAPSKRTIGARGADNCTTPKGNPKFCFWTNDADRYFVIEQVGAGAPPSPTSTPTSAPTSTPAATPRPSPR
ncbi:hypothetical protein BH11PLA1_BH11PLA1_15050 [soil metagenome]